MFFGGGALKSWCGKLCFEECRYNLAPIYICEVWGTMGSAQVLLNSRMCGQSRACAATARELRALVARNLKW